MEVTSTTIKNSFGKYLRLCANEPIYITKNGKRIAKLSDIGESLDPYGVELDCGDVYVNETANNYTSANLRMTYEEFTTMNKTATNRYEFIDGEVYLLASPTITHQYTVKQLLLAFDRFLEGSPCEAFIAPFDVILKRKLNDAYSNVVQPDVMILYNWQADADETDKYQGIPTLVVEVLSPSNKSWDLIKKLDLYRDSGVKEYWVVNGESTEVTVYSFKNYDIDKMKSYTNSDTCNSFHFEGLSVPVAKLFP